MMKEEAKRQQSGEAPLTTTSTSSTIPFNQGGNTVQTSPSTNAAQDTPEPDDGSVPDDGSPGASAITFNYEAITGFADGSKVYLKDGTQIIVPIEMNPALRSPRAFSIKKEVCGLQLENSNTPPLSPNCRSLDERRSSGPDSSNEAVSFQLFSGPEAYYLKLTWTFLDDNADVPDTTVGYSFSRVFGKEKETSRDKISDTPFKEEWGNVVLSETVPSNGEPGQPAEVRVIITAEEGEEYRPQELQSVLNQAAASVGGSESSRSTAVTGITGPTPTPTVNNNPAGGESDVSEATPSQAPSSGGLQKPAIIGIAVAAAIVGLAAIGLLVWFFCLRNRRRRGSKDHGPYAAPDHQASEYMVNKETTGPHVTESPHSPYSDDGSLAHAQGQGHTSLAQAQQTHQYSDAPPIAAPVPRSASQQAGDRPGSGAGTRSGTPGGGNNVSHLIEEGMTEADIRRLEEEERALDDAIERAGHGRR